MHLNLSALLLFWIERRVLLSHIHSTQPGNFVELMLWAMFTWRPWIKCLEIHNCIHVATHDWYNIIFPWFERFFLHKRRLLIDLISRGIKIWPHPLNTRQSEPVTVSLFFSPAVLSTTPTYGHSVLSPVLLTSRDQGRVVQKPVNVNPGLNVNWNITFSYLKMFFASDVYCSLRLLQLKTEGQTI